MDSWYLGMIITAIFVFVPKPIARIFFHEATAIEIAVDYLIIVGLSEAFMCVELMTVGALSGLGKTHLCSVISLYLQEREFHWQFSFAEQHSDLMESGVQFHQHPL